MTFAVFFSHFVIHGLTHLLTLFLSFSYELRAEIPLDSLQELGCPSLIKTDRWSYLLLCPESFSYKL